MYADWRSIDTAPRDGALVLLAYPGTDMPVRIGRWVASYSVTAAHWFSFSGVFKRHREVPTAWMPLPRPPGGRLGRIPAPMPDPPPRRGGAIALPLPGESEDE